MSPIRDAVAALGGMRGICQILKIEFQRDMIVPWRSSDRGKKLRMNGVNSGKERWYDYKEGIGGDEVDFWARCRGISNSEACRELIQLAGLRGQSPSKKKHLPKSANQPAIMKQADMKTRVKPQCPVLRRAEPREIDAISAVRGVPSQVVEMLCDMGVIRIAEKWGLSCWFYLDSLRQNIRLRRLDGQPFRQSKAMALEGSWASFPIGMDRLKTASRVLMVEGEGDGMSAWASAWADDNVGDVAVCVMSGASVSIPVECVNSFTGKRVRIVPHVGDTGRIGELAALKWGKVLEASGASVDIYRLKEGDLGDLIKGRSVDEIRSLSLTKF